MERFNRAVLMAGAVMGFVAFAPAWLGAGAQAQSVADFYKGRQIVLKIGSSPGGGYDIVGRAVARHITRHIPGTPGIIVQNIPGGGSLRMTNQLVNTGKKDGSEFALGSSGMPTTPLLSPKAAHYDPRSFNWIGSLAPIGEVLVVTNDAPVQKLDDIYTTELIVGASSPGSAIMDFPYILNVLTGTKFKIVAGYKGATDIGISMERGEVHGLAGYPLGSMYTTRIGSMWKEGKVKLIGQFGYKPNRRIADVPLFRLPSGKEEMQMIKILYSRMDYGRPFFMIAGNPADRVTAIRSAFEAMVKDAKFLADAEKAGLEIDPTSHAELAALTEDLYKTPPEVAAKMTAIFDKVRSKKKKKKKKAE